MDFKKRFGTNLRRKRLAAGISQQELSRRSDLDRAGVWSLEQGYRQPRLETMIKLAKVLGTDLNELAEGIDWDEGSLRITVEPARH
jgi:transcriptional regulator with XRE-family HTH domain